MVAAWGLGRGEGERMWFRRATNAAFNNPALEGREKERIESLKMPCNNPRKFLDNKLAMSPKHAIYEIACVLVSLEVW